jgi:tetratricopeptide (TPR) repeat protein
MPSSVHRTIVCVDIEGFGDRRRTNPYQLTVRAGLYRALETAFQQSGIDWSACYQEDRGDGVFILVPSEVPKNLLVARMPGLLAAALEEHNSLHDDRARIRLRLALHAGEILMDDHGVVGTSVNLAFRLLEAPPLKLALARSAGLLAVISSAWFYEDVVRHDPVAETYRRVEVKVKETSAEAWITTPDAPGGAWQVGHERAPASPEPGRAEGHGRQRQKPAELPLDVADFIGRQRELRHIKKMAGGANVITVAGKAGAGKSALILHAAHDLQSRFPDGQVFLNLAGMRPDPLPLRTAISMVLAAFGEDTDPTADEAHLLSRYRSLLAGRKVLLVLDDAHDEAQVRPLLPGSRTCLTLITSRRRLVALTEAPPPLNLEGFAKQEGLELLVAIAGPRARGEMEAARTVVEQCGHLPLAVRIAGARLRSRPKWSMRYLAERLADERRRLDELKVGDLEVRASIALSYAELTAADATTFRLLSAIPGRDFSAEIAAAALDTDAAAALARMEVLADAQLLETMSAVSFAFHDLILLYAQERFSAEDSAVVQSSVLDRTLRAYHDQLLAAGTAMGLVRAHDRRMLPPVTEPPAEPAGTHVSVSTPLPGGANDHVSAARFVQREQPSLLAALYAAERAGDARLTWELADTLLPCLENTQAHRDLLQQVAQTAERAAGLAGDPNRVMLARYAAGRVARLNGDLTEAIATLQDAAQHFQERDEPLIAAVILITLGAAYREAGRAVDAADVLLTAFELRASQGHNRATDAPIADLAAAVKDMGRLSDAAELYELALRLEHDDRLPDDTRSRKTAWTHENLGALLKHLGRLDEAEHHHSTSLNLFTQVGQIRGQAYATRNLGDIALLRGDARQARARYDTAMELFRSLGDRVGQAQTAASATLLHLRAGRPHRAVAALIRYLRLSRQLKQQGNMMALKRLRRRPDASQPQVRELPPRVAAFLNDARAKELPE